MVVFVCFVCFLVLFLGKCKGTVCFLDVAKYWILYCHGLSPDKYHAATCSLPPWWDGEENWKRGRTCGLR